MKICPQLYFKNKIDGLVGFCLSSSVSVYLVSLNGGRVLQVPVKSKKLKNVTPLLRLFNGSFKFVNVDIGGLQKAYNTHFDVCGGDGKTHGFESNSKNESGDIKMGREGVTMNLH